MPRLVAPAAIVAAVALIAPLAVAHSYLQTASPPVNSTVTATPNQVVITFTQAIEPRYATIEVTNANHQRVDDGESHLAGSDAKRLGVPLQPLPPATYTVVWRATSVDTHNTEGSSQFTVAAVDPSAISLEHVWARATPGTATTGAVYLTVTDNGRPDRLVGVSTPIAAMAEMHETIHDNGVMKMRPVAGGIALDPGKPVTFTPGGYHVMLTGLKSPLKAGDSFPLTLTFEHARSITVSVHVEAMGAGGMNHDGMQSMPGMQDQKP